MISTYNQAHLGHLPVRVLQHNIVSAFEVVSPNFLDYAKRVIREQRLDPEIGYTINKSSTEGHQIIGPHVKNKERKIYIDETFLAYVWCICYALYVEINNQIDPGFGFDLTKSDALFKYAKRLKEEYVNWDKSLLINPESYSIEDKNDIEKTNAIFERSLAFILCHEFFHIELGHIDRDICIHKEQSLEKLENECEADKRAVELMLSGCNTENEEVVKYGITFALCASLFLREKLARDTHPDSDNRIIEALDGLDLDKNDKCWCVACVSLNLWQRHYGMSATWVDQGSCKDTFIYVSRQFD